MNYDSHRFIKRMPENSIRARCGDVVTISLLFINMC